VRSLKPISQLESERTALLRKLADEFAHLERSKERSATRLKQAAGTGTARPRRLARERTRCTVHCTTRCWLQAEIDTLAREEHARQLHAQLAAQAREFDEARKDAHGRCACVGVPRTRRVCVCVRACALGRWRVCVRASTGVGVHACVHARSRACVQGKGARRRR
jgi:hypothetical protein